jgi:hypothetical protein
MSRINLVQQKISELEGGKFQNMCDTYLFKKYGLENITTLGSQDGTDKTTPGVPDSYVKYNDGTYTFVMYGTHQDVKRKIKKDIQDCLDEQKTGIEISKIRKIICCHTSTNISTRQNETFKETAKGVELQLIGLDTLGEDLASPKFQNLAKDFLAVPFGTNQIFDIEGFIKANDVDATTSPLDMDFKFRESKLLEITNALGENNVALVTGASGVGKSRISLEVCKKFQEMSYEVLCIKNNGSDLHTDFEIATSEPGKYLIFMDDINLVTNLQPIINWILENTDASTEIKIIATVRDYARKEVSELLESLGNVQKIVITNFKDEELRKIISDCLNIKNGNFQDRILDIAQGNVRLAVLAGQLAIEQVEKINNPTELFRSYYSRVIGEGRITTSSVQALFIIALSNTVNIEQDKFPQILLKEFGISKNKFHDITYDLNQKELVDLYLNQIVRINDQSFRDYVLEYVLIERKYIRIDRLLKLGFANEKSKIIYALNTVCNLFQSKQNISYISEQVNSQWNSVDAEESISYLKSFYSLNYPKTLEIISDSIDKLKSSSFKVTKEYINQNKNNQILNSLEMQVLSNFKNTEFFKHAIKLSLNLLDKRPDYFMDIYFSFTKNFSYDKYSANSDYKQELTLLEVLYSSTSEEQLNHYYVLLEVIKVLLKTSSSGTESKKNGRSFIFYSFDIHLTEGSKNLRRRIWEILSKLYSKKYLQKDILKIIDAPHWTGKKAVVKPIFEFDMSCIEKEFIGKWTNLSIEQALALTILSNNAQSFHIDVEHYFDKYSGLPKKKYYDVLKPRSYHETWDNSQNLLNQKIKDLTKSFDLSDYHNLFQLANQLEQVSINQTREIGLIGNNLKIAIENSPKKLLEVTLTEYLQQEAPFSQYCFFIVPEILNKLGFETFYKLLSRFNFAGQNRWVSLSFEYLPAEEIDKERTKLLIQFVESQVKESAPCIPRLETIVKYVHFNKNIVNDITHTVNLLNNKENSLASNFIVGYFCKPATLVKIFEANISDLEELYMQIEQESFDYDNALLVEIINADPTFWKTYIISLKEKTSLQSDLFKQIWKLDNYTKLINIAFENLILNIPYYVFYGIYDTIFATDTSDNQVNARIRNWIVNYLKDNISNKRLIRDIFFYYISNQSEDTREFFIEIFLKYDSNIDDFKSINILPTSHSFSGSEVPLINADINFLTRLTSVDFIKCLLHHDIYIHDQINKKRQYKKEVQLREYQENLE